MIEYYGKLEYNVERVSYLFKDILNFDLTDDEIKEIKSIANVYKNNYFSKTHANFGNPMTLYYLDVINNFRYITTFEKQNKCREKRAVLLLYMLDSNFVGYRYKKEAYSVDDYKKTVRSEIGFFNPDFLRFELRYVKFLIQKEIVKQQKLLSELQEEFDYSKNFEMVITRNKKKEN